MSTPPEPLELRPPDDAALGLELEPVSDELMKQRLGETESYTLLILKRTPKLVQPQVDPIIREHGRRNMALHYAGLMPIICPIREHSELAGICILTVPPERAAEILSEDPGVKAGILTFEVVPTVGFPGSTLPRQGAS